MCPRHPPNTLHKKSSSRAKKSVCRAQNVTRRAPTSMASNGLNVQNGTQKDCPLRKNGCGITPGNRLEEACRKIPSRRSPRERIGRQISLPPAHTESAQKGQRSCECARAPCRAWSLGRRLRKSTHQRSSDAPLGALWLWLRLDYSLHPACTYGKLGVGKCAQPSLTYAAHLLRRAEKLPDEGELGLDGRKSVSSAQHHQLGLETNVTGLNTSPGSDGGGDELSATHEPTFE